MIENLIIGKLINGLTNEKVGILESEETIYIDIETANDMEVFLPRLLVHAGIFKSTSEIKRIHKDRIKSNKIADPDSKNLWRILTRPEMTYFKIGKKAFWLFVGKLN